MPTKRLCLLVAFNILLLGARVHAEAANETVTEQPTLKFKKAKMEAAPADAPKKQTLSTGTPKQENRGATSQKIEATNSDPPNNTAPEKKGHREAEQNNDYRDR